MVKKDKDTTMEQITMNTNGAIVKEYPMQPRHKIDKKYNENPRHIRRWELTIDWLKTFQEQNHIPYHPVYVIKGNCLDCGDRTHLTGMIEKEFNVGIVNTIHDLNNMDEPYYKNENDLLNNVFIFEVIEHLLNPLMFVAWVKINLSENGFVFLSTPIFRPKWMRNKEWHFHEFNYNELVHLIDVAGFKIVDEKIIQPTKWYYAFTGFRPFLRVLGFDRNILMCLARK